MVTVIESEDLPCELQCQNGGILNAQHWVCPYPPGLEGTDCSGRRYQHCMGAIMGYEYLQITFFCGTAPMQWSTILAYFDIYLWYIQVWLVLYMHFCLSCPCLSMFVLVFCVVLVYSCRLCCLPFPSCSVLWSFFMGGRFKFLTDNNFKISWVIFHGHDYIVIDLKLSWRWGIIKVGTYWILSSRYMCLTADSV